MLGEERQRQVTEEEGDARHGQKAVQPQRPGHEPSRQMDLVQKK